ncbi:hypothetical protein D3C72_669840 [compost metagenome]
MPNHQSRGFTVLLAAIMSGCGTVEAPTDFTVLQEMGGTHHAAPSTGKALMAQLSVDSVEGGTMWPGKRAEWRFDFIDATALKPVLRFDIHHEKAMHLLVVRRDLSSFAHLHPTLGPDGRFRLVVNASNDDLDNQDATEVIRRPGLYFLFAEVKPSGQSVSPARLTVHADGEERPERLMPDDVSANGDIVAYATAEGRSGREGDLYRVTLRSQRGAHHPGMPMMSFSITVRERDPQGRYVDVRNLERWLGMPGHAVLIGAQGERIEDRVFRHLHAVEDSGANTHAGTRSSGALSFMAMGEDVPPPGLYRLWCQFKHQGRIVTVPMTLSL